MLFWGGRRVCSRELLLAGRLSPSLSPVEWPNKGINYLDCLTGRTKGSMLDGKTDALSRSLMVFNPFNVIRRTCVL